MKHETLVAAARHQFERFGYVLHAMALQLQQLGINVAMLERNWNEGR